MPKVISRTMSKEPQTSVVTNREGKNIHSNIYRSVRVMEIESIINKQSLINRREDLQIEIDEIDSLLVEMDQVDQKQTGG